MPVEEITPAMTLQVMRFQARELLMNENNCRREVATATLRRRARTRGSGSVLNNKATASELATSRSNRGDQYCSWGQIQKSLFACCMCPPCNSERVILLAAHRLLSTVIDGQTSGIDRMAAFISA